MLPVLTHWWKDLSIDFVTSLSISANWKDDSYDLILVIVDRLIKMVYYESVKVTIDAPGLAKMIIDMVVRQQGVLESIITDRGLLFTSKFWSLLCYFLGIKKKLSTAFYPQINDQTKRQNSRIEAYLRIFVNWEQDDWTKLLTLAKFAFNNTKNASTGHTLFELNCDYHSRVSFKEDVDPRSRSCSANKLAKKLRELIKVCCQNLFHI